MSDWIKCDGTGMPDRVPHRARVAVKYSGTGKIEIGSRLSSASPHFFWRWRWVRSGLLRWKRVRVCQQPEFAPIVAIRVIRPRALEQLIEMVETLPADAALPEELA